jgi:hypothetical protein
VAFDVVSAYTLVIGDEDGPASVGVYASAEEAWRALDREVRSRCRMRPRPRRVVDAEATTRLADAWRAGDPESRYWQIRCHSLPVAIPVIGRPPVPATPPGPGRPAHLLRG